MPLTASLGEFWQELTALTDRSNDRDIEEGAGEVMLEILKAADDSLLVAEISGKHDLLSAVATLLNPSDGQVRLQERDMALVLSALRLVSVGYYRSLIVEERFRVGRLGCRAEAVRRFRERLLEE